MPKTIKHEGIGAAYTPYDASGAQGVYLVLAHDVETERLLVCYCGQRRGHEDVRLVRGSSVPTWRMMSMFLTVFIGGAETRDSVQWKRTRKPKVELGGALPSTPLPSYPPQWTLADPPARGEAAS